MHTFTTDDGIGNDNIKMTTGPGHVDAHGECSGGTGGDSYPTECSGKGADTGDYD